MSQVTTVEDLERLRHSSAHVLAQAVLALFPEAKLAIGPAMKNVRRLLKKRRNFQEKK
jgi:threonyl-tRNA synthetase